MSPVTFTVDTPVPPEAVLAAATNFTERRPELWPNLDPKAYRVHEVDRDEAEVSEGSAIMGGIWARERYRWAPEGSVVATVLDSNVFRSGSTWKLTVAPAPGGGSRVEVVWDKHGRGVRGRMLVAMVRVVGRKVLSAQLRKTLEILEREEPARS